MAKNSTYGVSWSTEISKLCREIMSNSGHIDKDDLELLKFLAYKGSFDEKRGVLIDKSSRLNNLLTK